MHAKKRILLKLTGEIFLSPKDKTLTSDAARHIIDQIAQLQETHQFGIVIGGGNFFRGKDQGVALGMTASVGHQAGMLATMINGLILKDACEQKGLAAALLCALTCPEIGTSISQQAIETSLTSNQTLIFTGGTGNPFFTNDTNAVIRGLQIQADEIWKASNIDGVYSADPKKFPDAQLLKRVTFEQARTQKLGIMDATAFTLAEQYNQPIRVFDAFTRNALITASRDKNFGTFIHD